MGLLDRMREARKRRREGPERSYYGGTIGEQQNFQKKAGQDENAARERETTAYDSLRKQKGRAAEDTDRARTEYRDRATATGNTMTDYGRGINAIGDAANKGQELRNTALGRDRLTGTAENALQQRSNALAASPNLMQATNQAIAAQEAASRDQLAQKLGMMNRQARGLAGSMGEGGALAMQQALASAGAGAADVLATNQTGLDQRSSEMRYGAAQAQRAEDVASADLGLGTRMDAAAAERQAMLDTAERNASGLYDASLQQQNARGNLMQTSLATQDMASGRQQNFAAQENALEGAGYEAAANSFQNAVSNRAALEGTLMGVDMQRRQAEYEAAQNTGFTAFMGRLSDGFTNLKAAADSSDLGIRSKIIPNQQRV